MIAVVTGAEYTLSQMLQVVWGWGAGVADAVAEKFLNFGFHIPESSRISTVYSSFSTVDHVGRAPCGYSSRGAFPNRTFVIHDPPAFRAWVEELRAQYVLGER